MCLWILGMHSVQTTPRCEDPKSLPRKCAPCGSWMAAQTELFEFDGNKSDDGSCSRSHVQVVWADRTKNYIAFSVVKLTQVVTAGNPRTSKKLPYYYMINVAP